MYCKYCGKVISDNSRFCAHCGRSIESSNCNFMESGKQLLISNVKMFSIVFLLIICFVGGWFWYTNTPGVKIVGEWRGETNGGIDYELFNEDGVWEHKKESYSFGHSYTIGKWEISGHNLITAFWYNGKKLTDEYEITKLSSKELVLKYKKSGSERRYKRIDAE